MLKNHGGFPDQPFLTDPGSPHSTRTLSSHPEGSVWMPLPFASASGPSCRGHHAHPSQPHSPAPGPGTFPSPPLDPPGTTPRFSAGSPRPRCRHSGSKGTHVQALVFPLGLLSRSRAVPGARRNPSRPRNEANDPLGRGPPASAQARPSILTSAAAPGCCQDALSARLGTAPRSSATARSAASGTPAPKPPPRAAPGSPAAPRGPQRHPSRPQNGAVGCANPTCRPRSRRRRAQLRDALARDRWRQLGGSAARPGAGSTAPQGPHRRGDRAAASPALRCGPGSPALRHPAPLRPGPRPRARAHLPPAPRRPPPCPAPRRPRGPRAAPAAPRLRTEHAGKRRHPALHYDSQRAARHRFSLRIKASQ